MDEMYIDTLEWITVDNGQIIISMTQGTVIVLLILAVIVLIRIIF
jgi:hypothetical protein